MQVMPEIVARLREAGCVFAEDEARLLISEAKSHDQLCTLVDKRVMGFPLEHILGWAEFGGTRAQVSPGVFVPRRRTELLLREAAALIRQSGVQSTVVELCCGSGAVGAILAAWFENVEVYAVDVDLAAVQCARRNIARGHVYHGHLYEPLPAALAGRVDLVIANAPYVPTGEIAMLPSEARLYEPMHALDGGPDGLDVQREIAAEAAHWLRSGGHLLLETSEHQALRTIEIFVSNGLQANVTRSDQLDATVVTGAVGPAHLKVSAASPAKSAEG